MVVKVVWKKRMSGERKEKNRGVNRSKTKERGR